MIPFNKPFLSGLELTYIEEAIRLGKLSGNGVFTKRCHEFFEKRFGFPKVLLTTSGTDALEMAAILLNIQPGDEVIMPSFTFVSTANAFVLRGARVVFVDCRSDEPNMDVSLVERLITDRTRAIVAVHYAGVACDMDHLMAIAASRKLFVVEDAAHAIDAAFRGKALGSIGHLAAFSFHETKNVSSGEGGMLVINDSSFASRAEIIWEKGTNRAAFWRGEVDKYGWVDIGSSFLPSELTAAFLLAQLENIGTIQKKRIQLWDRYYENLRHLQDGNLLKLPVTHEWATNNGHMFYVLCGSLTERDKLIAHLRERGVLAVFHYISLHRSPYYAYSHGRRELPNTDSFSDRLLRLPMFFELTTAEVDLITAHVSEFYGVNPGS